MFKFKVASRDILNIISYVEVLSPKELREYVKEKLQDIIQMYT